MFFDDAFPVETEEERRRRMAAQLTPTPSALGNGAFGSFLGASASPAAQVQQAVASAPAVVGEPQAILDNRYNQVRSNQPMVDNDPQSMLATWFKFATGLNPTSDPQSILDNWYSRASQPTQSPNTPSNTYQHYSATAAPALPEVAASQAARINSAFDQGNRVYINDGTAPVAAPMGPGAGYTSQGMDGVMRPIAHPTDMDYGTRIAMDPYTNPFIQDGIRQHERKMELQAQAINGELLKAQMLNGGRNDSAMERNLIRGLQISGDPRLPSTTRNTIIDSLQLPDKDKEMMKLDAAMTQLGPNKEPIEISPVKITSRDKEGRATGRTIDMTEFLSRVPKGVSQQTLLDYLKERRGMTRDDIVSHLAGIYDEASKGPIVNVPGAPTQTGDIKLERLSPARRKEHDLIIQFLGRR